MNTKLSGGTNQDCDGNLSAEQLDCKYNPHGDGEHPVHRRLDWRNEVEHGNTLTGYWEWVVSALFQDLHENPDMDRTVPTVNLVGAGPQEWRPQEPCPMPSLPFELPIRADGAALVAHDFELIGLCDGATDEELAFIVWAVNLAPNMASACQAWLDDELNDAEFADFLRVSLR